MKNIDQELISFIKKSSLNWAELQNKTILITGATGLIGKTLVKLLFQANNLYDLNLRLICLVRNKQKARALFKDINIVTYYFYQMGVVNISEKADYIVHAASMTQSQDFIKRPVDVIHTTIDSVNYLLEYAKEKRISAFVYLSTMEVYGQIQLDRKITEEDYGYMDSMSIRNSYPLGKKLAENLCLSYSTQYNVPTRVARLTLTFGLDVDTSDNRVFAQFIRSAINGEDIVLHTEGKTCRDYIHTLDAVMGILYILLKGSNGEAYNVANSSAYCSIREMAELIAQKSKDAQSRVVVSPPNKELLSSYAPEVKINLDTSKLERLGWKPNFSFVNMIDSSWLSLAP